jgi:hypothetical protein
MPEAEKEAKECVMSYAVHERWQQIAIHIGEQIRSSINTPEMIGTEDETGYVLMFFNARRNEMNRKDLDERERLLRRVRYAGARGWRMPPRSRSVAAASGATPSRTVLH